MLVTAIIIIILLNIISMDNHLRDNFVELTSNFDIINKDDILMKYPNNSITDFGEPGDWDVKIREIGNIVYNPYHEKYYFY